MTLQPMPVSHFPSSYLSLFHSAYTKTITKRILFHSAVHYRQQLHRFRRSLNSEKHPSASLANEVSISLNPAKAKKGEYTTMTIGILAENAFTTLFADDITDEARASASLARTAASGFTSPSDNPVLTPEEADRRIAELQLNEDTDETPYSQL